MDASPELLTLPQVAEALAVPITRVHQFLREGQFVSVRTDAGKQTVPAEFVQDGAVVKHLPAVITVLRDARYGDDEIVDWLFRPDDTLPSTPIQALRENRGREVKRRAQTSGF